MFPRNSTFALSKQKGNSTAVRWLSVSRLLHLERPKISEVPSSILTPTAGRDVNWSSSNLDVRECFAPFIPHVAVAPVPTPKPAAKFSGIQQALRDLGLYPSTDADPKAGVPAPEDATNDSDTDLSTEHPDEIPTASVETPLPIPPEATVPVANPVVLRPRPR